jgi:CheY-like chemotaxis protein
LTAELHALFIGDADYAEFRAAVAALARAARVHPAANLAAAIQLIAGGLRPELIVIAQQRPGEIAPEAVEGLRRLAPVAPCIAVQSSWCEAEGRSGRPLPGVVRVSWRRFESEIVPGLTRLRDGQLPDWAGPATLTSEERLLRQSDESLPRGRGTVGILSHSYEARRLLGDICRAGGWSVATLPASWISQAAEADALQSPLPEPLPEACDVVVWDAQQLPESTRLLSRLRERAADTEVVVLVDFPRQHDIERAAADGVAVVGKPVTAKKLLSEIDRAASRRRSQSSSR